jgi:hypothetical protein
VIHLLESIVAVLTAAIFQIRFRPELVNVERKLFSRVGGRNAK